MVHTQIGIFFSLSFGGLYSKLMHVSYFNGVVAFKNAVIMLMRVTIFEFIFALLFFLKYNFLINTVTQFVRYYIYFIQYIYHLLL